MGFFDKLKQGLFKTKENIGNNLNLVFSSFKSVDEELLQELEEILVLADLGIETASSIIFELRNRIKLKNIKEVEDVRNELNQIILEKLTFEERLQEDNLNENDLNREIKEPSAKCILVIGVNGVRKNYFNW